MTLNERIWRAQGWQRRHYTGGQPHWARGNDVVGIDDMLDYEHDANALFRDLVPDISGFQLWAPCDGFPWAVYDETEECIFEGDPEKLDTEEAYRVIGEAWLAVMGEET